MMINRSSDEKLAEHYEDIAANALANPVLSNGLANQIAGVSRNAAAALRGGKRDRAGRPHIMTDPVRQEIWIESSQRDAIDAVRGAITRAEWIRQAIERSLP